MKKQNTIEICKILVDNVSTGFNEITIVRGKIHKCTVCGKASRSCYELRIRGRKRIKGAPPWIGRGKYETYIGFRKRVFKHFGYVCSKPCETFLILATR